MSSTEVLWHKIVFRDDLPIILSQDDQDILLRLVREAGAVKEEEVLIPFEAFSQNGRDLLDQIFSSQDAWRIIQILKHAFEGEEWIKHNLCWRCGGGGSGIVVCNLKKNFWSLVEE